MNIEYSNSKECKCYKEFVENPTERCYIKKFCKTYSKEFMPSAIDIHNRLTKYNNVAEYNAVYGGTKNSIEIKQGLKDKDNFIFKVRVQNAFRKFFYQIIGDSFLIKKDWRGRFEDVVNIYVIDINNHGYNVK